MALIIIIRVISATSEISCFLLNGGLRNGHTGWGGQLCIRSQGNGSWFWLCYHLLAASWLLSFLSQPPPSEEPDCHPVSLSGQSVLVTPSPNSKEVTWVRIVLIVIIYCLHYWMWFWFYCTFFKMEENHTLVVLLDYFRHFHRCWVILDILVYFHVPEQDFC